MDALRHSFASWLASSGQVSIYELQKLLTHSSPQMTRRYDHLHDDALKKASSVAGNLFGSVLDDTKQEIGRDDSDRVKTGKSGSKKKTAGA